MGLLDSSSARAWSSFRDRLADHLAAIDHGASICFDVPVADESDLDGSPPYVQLGRDSDGLLSAEVSSNTYLDPSCALTTADEGTLLTLGWSEPDETTPQFYLRLDQREADRMASLVVRTMRDVFDVLHPSFLSCDVAQVLEQPDEPEPVRLETVQHPTTRAEVVDLVDATLAWYLGHDPFKDDDLDIPIVCGECVVYVRVPQEPAVLLISDLVREVSDVDAALFEVNVLNRDHRDVQFSYVDGTIRARRLLPVFPYVAQQVHDAVEHLCGLVEEVADDLAQRVDGRLFLDDDPEATSADADTDLPPEILTMLHLEADRPGSLDAELVASIFRMDRDLLLDRITLCEREELDDMVPLLRGALRLVVEAEAARLREAGSRMPRQRRSPESDDAEPQRSIHDQEPH
ncbi:MAG: hypothetical protein JWO46_2677 [Nocardioidaceae bacterium]|nr:hypothetical protein [Nocardioidaceae bacterium]